MTSLPHQYWPESGSSRVLSSRLVSAVFSASLWWKNLSKPWLTRVLTWAPVRYRRKSNYKLLGISKENLEIIDILVFPGKCLIQSYFALQTLKTLFDFSTLYYIIILKSIMIFLQNKWTQTLNVFFHSLNMLPQALSVKISWSLSVCLFG